MTELLEEAAQRTVDAISFEAVQLFTRIRKRSDEAAEAGDFKTAMAGDMFIAECFGYKDSPTLTHEHMGEKPLEIKQSEVVEQDRDNTDVPRFARVLAELRKTT